jgi:large subunit ribosomal protein L15
MKLNELRDRDGATKARKRVGRGIGSGSGKTAGRGEKGQSSRSGVALNGFEGGQMPVYRRLPKRGFKNIFSKHLNEVSLGRVQAAIDAKKLDAKETITVARLVEAGVVRRPKDGVKLLSGGELKTKVDFEVAGASKAAIEKIEKAGGSVTLAQKAAPKEA